MSAGVEPREKGRGLALVAVHAHVVGPERVGEDHDDVAVREGSIVRVCVPCAHVGGAGLLGLRLSGRREERCDRLRRRRGRPSQDENCREQHSEQRNEQRNERWPRGDACARPTQCRNEPGRRRPPCPVDEHDHRACRADSDCHPAARHRQVADDGGQVPQIEPGEIDGDAPAPRFVGDGAEEDHHPVGRDDRGAEQRDDDACGAGTSSCDGDDCTQHDEQRTDRERTLHRVQHDDERRISISHGERDDEQQRRSERGTASQPTHGTSSHVWYGVARGPCMP